MARTAHGHHIPGSPEDVYTGTTARCGGVGLCNQCSKEALQWNSHNPKPPSDNAILTEIARDILFRHLKDQEEQPTSLVPADIHIVWFAKTLQNWKALIIARPFIGYYYELTHNGDRDETYIDVYTKVRNIATPEEKEG